MVVVARGEVVEGLGVFAGEEEVLGEEAVFDGVLGDATLALGRDGSAGSGSVKTGSLDLSFSTHEWVLFGVLAILV
jgi:hypothetical protein